MTAGIIHDENQGKQIDKHMGGCMAGLFNLFDRNHVLSGKRFYPKRLPPSTAVESVSGSASSVGSPALSREFERPKPEELAKTTASLDRLRTPTPASPPPPATVLHVPPRSPVAVSSFEFKEGLKSPWKFAREAPRLSLDSRLHPREIRTSSAATGGGRRDGSTGSGADDESERHRRSPSIVARLMGLEPLLSSHSGADYLSEKQAELWRSASESRSRDLLHCRFIDGSSFPANLHYQSSSVFATNYTMDSNNDGRDLSNINIDNFNTYGRLNGGAFDHGGYTARSVNTEPTLKPHRRIAQQQQKKGLYDFGDFFPEPKPALSSIYCDIEKRLKIRGIDEPSMDLETLKQILEALQLKGLLHSKPPVVPTSQMGQQNFIYERRFPDEESPIVVMKPTRSPRRLATEPSPPRFQSKPPPRRNLNVTGGDFFSQLSQRRERSEISRSAKSPMKNPNPAAPGRSENRSISPATTRRKGTLNIETRRKVNETTRMEPRRISPVQSPRRGSRGMDQTASRSPRRQKSTAEIRSGRVEDESSTISESSSSTYSHTDTERWKMEDYYKDGKTLLERCDKLLHSITEMNSTTNSSTELQPSPVSVLDSSFYKEESSSPVMKRTIDFKDQGVELEDELWSPSSSGGAFQLKSSDTEDKTGDQQDPYFAYVSDIIRASNYLPDDSELFLLLEKRQSIRGRDTSKSSKLHRRLIFDTITEILNRNRQLPPWKSVSCEPQLTEIWSELQRIQKRDQSEDLFKFICGVMKRDLTRDLSNGWEECQLELSEVVLDMERLIFKDLIGEMIHDLVAFARKGMVARVPRRKLVF